MDQKKCGKTGSNYETESRLTQGIVEGGMTETSGVKMRGTAVVEQAHVHGYDCVKFYLM